MAYSSKNGRRPDENASKISHSHIINDKDVKEFISNCAYPKSKEEIHLDPSLLVDIVYPEDNKVNLIVAVDGGYTTVSVKKTFPSSQISFFQIGTLVLKTEDLNSLSEKPFISRESMSTLKELERDKLVLPTKNVAYKENLTLTNSVRQCIYEYFKNKKDKNTLLETLYWFLFETYIDENIIFQLANCPNCGNKIELNKEDFDKYFISKSCKCNQNIYLTDVFRFNEVIDDELGAGGILGYLTNILEHFNVIHTIKFIHANKPDLLKNILFIKDGPLAFFGQTARLHLPMRNLCNFLFKNYNVLLVGLEKNGAFVEHAEEIKDMETFKPGHAYLLNNKHIYKYILPGDPDTPNPYANTSYYSSKLIFKSRQGRMHVVTLPVENENIVLNPEKLDFKNIDVILDNIERLRCDMYDNSIIPVALANKLISLSNHPSSILLEKFSKSFMK